jgi:hypothetical protein
MSTPYVGLLATDSIKTVQVNNMTCFNHTTKDVFFILDIN